MKSPYELAFQTLDILVPHLEAKLARVTGHPTEWRFGHVRAALDVLRGYHVVSPQAIGRGGSGDVPGSQHSRDCVDESCRTPVPGRHALGEEQHHCGVEEAPLAKFSAFELAALDAMPGPFAEDERDAFFFGA